MKDLRLNGEKGSLRHTREGDQFFITTTTFDRGSGSCETQLMTYQEVIDDLEEWKRECYDESEIPSLMTRYQMMVEEDELTEIDLLFRLRFQSEESTSSVLVHRDGLMTEIDILVWGEEDDHDEEW